MEKYKFESKSKENLLSLACDELKVDDKGLVTTEEHKLVIDPAVWVFAGFMLFILILVISTAMRKIISKFKSKKGGSA